MTRSYRNAGNPGGDCQNVIDKWKKISDEQSAEIDQKLKDNPLEALVIDKEVAKGGYDMTQRPGWLGNVGAEVMTSDEAKVYVQQWNGRDLTKIDVNSPEWTKFAVFASDPENQAMLVSGGLLVKDITKAAISFLIICSPDWTCQRGFWSVCWSEPVTVFRP